MDNIGEILKAKREKKGLDFEAVREDTGIIREHLEALESNDFLHFPNKVYARSFLRDYANYLCLDTFKILETFEEEYKKLTAEPEKEEEPAPAPSEEIKFSEELPTESSFLNKTVGIFVVFVLLCVGAFFIGRAFGNKDADKTVNVPKPAAQEGTFVPVENKPATVNVPEKKSQDDKVAAAVKEADKQAEKEIAKAREFDTVTVYAHRNIWVKIEVDGKPAYEGTIKSGANLEFKVRNNIKLRGGEPTACQINVNGKSIGKLGTKGKPFDLLLTPKTGSVVKQ